MDEDGDMIVILISLVMLSCICFSCISLVVLLWKKDDVFKKLLTFGGGDPDIDYTNGALVPITSDAFNNKTWNIQHVSNKNNVTIDGDAFKFTLRKNISGGQSGASFASNPFGKFPTDSCSLSYELFIPDDFPLNAKGGKLPGLCIGKGFKDCATGGDYSTTEGSIRLMFREDTIITYVYPPGKNSSDAMNIQGSKYKSQAQATKAGHKLWHDKKSDLVIKRGWNNIKLQSTLNTVGKKNGVIKTSVNGKSNSVSDAVLRTDNGVAFTSVKMVVFFGGSGKEWEVDKDTYVKIRNVYVS